MRCGSAPRRGLGEDTDGSSGQVGETHGSGCLLCVAVFHSLLTQGLEHVRGIKAIPQPPIGLRTPHLVEQRLQLGVKVGRVGL